MSSHLPLASHEAVTLFDETRLVSSGPWVIVEEDARRYLARIPEARLRLFVDATGQCFDHEALRLAGLFEEAQPPPLPTESAAMRPPETPGETLVGQTANKVTVRGENLDEDAEQQVHKGHPSPPGSAALSNSTNGYANSKGPVVSGGQTPAGQPRAPQGQPSHSIQEYGTASVSPKTRGRGRGVEARVGTEEATDDPSGSVDANGGTLSEGHSQPRRPGRPRLGVVAREVTLLPEHWEWLAAQPGGASKTLRKLVEEARAAAALRERQQQAYEVAFRVAQAMAHFLPPFEEALLAIYAGDREQFELKSADWPEDIRAFFIKLGFEMPASGTA